jgi:hypothetical protein
VTCLQVTLRSPHTLCSCIWDSKCIPSHLICCLTPLQTSSTLMFFLLAMVLYPDAQKRAQAEIDSVIGRDRLPTFEDRASLPYVDAIERETFRWNPVLPLGDLRYWVISSLLNSIFKRIGTCYLEHGCIRWLFYPKRSVIFILWPNAYNMNIVKERPLWSMYGQVDSPPKLS